MNAKYQRRKLTNAERSATENTDCMVDALAKLLFARPWIAAAKAAATFTLRAKLSGAVYCNRSCLWVCLCVFVYLCVWGSVTTITRNCVHRSPPNCVCR